MVLVQFASFSVNLMCAGALRVFPGAAELHHVDQSGPKGFGALEVNRILSRNFTCNRVWSLKRPFLILSASFLLESWLPRSHGVSFPSEVAVDWQVLDQEIHHLANSPQIRTCLRQAPCHTME